LTTGCRRDTIEFELSEEVVILGKGTLSFVDLDHDGRLVVGGGGEGLGLLGRNDCVSGDDLGEDTASGFDTQSERANVDEENVASAFFT